MLYQVLDQVILPGLTKYQPVDRQGPTQRVDKLPVSRQWK
jgi:hypothetical protein